MRGPGLEELCADLEALWPAPHQQRVEEVGGAVLSADDATLYGELLTESLDVLLDVWAPRFAGGACFVDLGSGRGKLAVCAALHPLVRASRGVELLHCHHEAALALAEAAEARGLLSPAASLLLTHGCAFELASEWAADADVVFCNCVAWPDSALEQLARAAERTKPGTLVLTLTHALRSDAFRSLSSRGVRCSWSPHVPLYVAEHRGRGWQRSRPGPDGAQRGWLLGLDGLQALGWLRLLRLPPAGARLMLPSAGNSPLPTQLAALDGVASVHAFDFCARIAAAAAAAAASPGLSYSRADAEDARLCTRACAAPCTCEPFQLLPASFFDAVIDQAALDALAPVSAIAAHRSLACSFAALRPGGVLLLLSAAPPARALPLLRAVPGCRWLAGTAHASASWGGETLHAYALTKPPARSLLLSGNRVLPAPHVAYAGGCCSYAAMGRVFATQAFFDCLSCAMEAVCAACARKCHMGHELARADGAEAPPLGGRWGAEALEGAGPLLLRDTTLGFCECGHAGSGCLALLDEGDV